MEFSRLDEFIKMLPISGFSNYFVNREGQVWSNHSNKFLQALPGKSEYYEFNLSSDNAKETVWTRGRILLTTFVRHSNPGEVCRHLNDIKTDDRLKNLAWGTYGQNLQDAIKNGRRLPFIGENNVSAKLFPLDVINILFLHTQGLKQDQIAELYHVHQVSISNIILGRTWNHIHSVVVT